MKRYPDNQINASFIDISRIKWLVFFIWSSFFRTTSTVASSEAPADYQPASGRRDIKDNLWLERQRNRSWIRDLAKIHKIVNSFIDGSAFLSGGHRSMFPRTSRNSCVYTCHPTFVTATSDVLTWLPAKLSKNGMRVKTSTDRRLKIKLRV